MAVDDADILALHMTVGEIRSDVKRLLASDSAYDARLRKVEYRQWWMTGVGAALAIFATKLGLPDLATLIQR